MTMCRVVCHSFVVPQYRAQGRVRHTHQGIEAGWCMQSRHECSGGGRGTGERKVWVSGLAKLEKEREGGRGAGCSDIKRREEGRTGRGRERGMRRKVRLADWPLVYLPPGLF